MTHFLSLFENVTRSYWNEPGMTNFRGKTYTHAEIATEIEKLHLVFQKIGLKRGDKVALCGKNSAEWAIAFFAVTSYHAVAVPLLANFTPQNINNLTNHAEATLLFTDKKIFTDIVQADVVPALKAIVDFDGYKTLYSEAPSYQEAFESRDLYFRTQYPDGLTPETIHYEAGDSEEMVVINYTSGTTGQPKGIMIPARSITSNVVFGHHKITATPGEHALSMLPLAHMYGLTFEFMYTFLGGCHVYFLGKMPTPTILMAAFAEVKPYILITVPLVLEKIIKKKVLPVLQKPAMKALLKIPGVNKLVFKKIHKIIMQAFGGNVRDIPVGGAAMSKPVEKVLRQIEVPFTVGYGMTECGPLIGYADWRKFAPGSCGKIVDNMQIRVDSNNWEKEVGELQVKGDNVMLGYYKNPEATKATFTQDGWLRTGDLGIIDQKGNIYIKGRSKCMILTSNGQNIYPEEIESLLNDLPHVKESLVLERNKKLIALVALDYKEEDLKMLDLEQFKNNLRSDINKVQPNYSQINQIEILEKGFEHTPKNTIKRNLYK